MPQHGPAGAHPDTPHGEPELLQPDADPRLHPRQRRRPRQPRPRRRHGLLQHLVDQVLRLEAPRLLGVHLVHLRVRERRRRPQHQHLVSAAAADDEEEVVMTVLVTGAGAAWWYELLLLAGGGLAVPAAGTCVPVI